MIDTESSAAPEFWNAVGVQIPNLVYGCCTTVEEIFKNIEHIIGTVRKKNSDKLVVVVVDSLAAASSEKEMEAEHGVDGYNTAKAIVISKAMRKITSLIAQQRVLLVFTNQLRMNMSTFGFGDKYVVPGGKSKDYHYSVRIRLGSTGKLKKGTNIIGTSVEARVTKNRLGPPHRKAFFDVHFDSGIQDLASWLVYLKDNKFATKDGRSYNISLPGKDKIKLNAAEFVEKINTEAEFKDAVYQTICEHFIMKYRDPNSKIDEDVTVDTEDKVGDD